MSESAILGRQVALLYRNLPLGQAVSVVNATLLAWLWRDSAGTAAVTLWWLAACAVALARFGLALAYRRRQDDDLPALPWWRRARLGATGGGLVWAAGALLFMLGAPTVQQIFTAFVMAGMVAGAVPVLAADRAAFRLYAWPVVAVTALAVLGSDPLHIAFAVMSVVFLIACTQSADHFHHALLESLRLQHEKEALVASLDAARRVAESSDRAKTEFLANVSHELRTPMNGILGMAEILAMEELPDASREFLGHLRQSADELLLLINNLIELSALEAGQLQLRAAPFALADLLPALASAAARQAAAKGLALHAESDQRLPAVVVGDSERLRKVLAQLLDNALKFTERGEIRIAARLLSRRDDVVQVEFTVADTGPGIAPEKLRCIFELFTQADGSVTRRHAGTGIGLPICRKLAELMQGTLNVDSRPGAGSSFRLRLPFALPLAAETTGLSPDSSGRADRAPA